MGTPEFAVPSLEHLMLNQYQIVAVYTRPDKPSGRGRLVVTPPVKKAAVKWKLPIMQPVSLKKAEVVAQIAGFHPDVIVVTAFGQVLPQSVLDIPKYGCLNIHPSLLPRFRGVSPIAAAILAGDESTGVSIMLMDQGLDTGPILARRQIPISPQDTTNSLMSRLSLVAAPLLQEVLPYWLKGELTPHSQNDAEATYCRPISKNEGEIDWCLPAVDIWRRVRAFYPWPGCYTTWGGKQLKIIEAIPLDEEGLLEVGQVVAVNRGVRESEVAFGIKTGKGVLGVLKVQLGGKRVMPAAEFLRGQRQLLESILK
jgi:methionyl-tRNA formyltransferase